MIIFIQNVFFLSVSKLILLFFIFCYFAFSLRSTCIYKEVAEALQSELNVLLLDLKRKTNINLIQKTRKTKHKKKASFYLFILVFNISVNMIKLHRERGRGEGEEQERWPEVAVLDRSYLARIPRRRQMTFGTVLCLQDWKGAVAFGVQDEQSS